MRTPRLLARFSRGFLEAPLPEAVFQVAPGFVTGLRVLVRERRAGGRFAASLPEGAVRPAFEGGNIADPAAVEARVRDGMRGLGLTQGAVAVLVPELCTRVFLFSLDSAPASGKERERIVRWRVGKSMPSLPEDARFVHQSLPSNGGELVVAAVARPEVLREYEGLFHRCGLAPGFLTPPSLCLAALLPRDAGDALVVNVEEDSLSLTAVVGGLPALFRQKPFASDREPGGTAGRRAGPLVQEIENTALFLEDKEKVKVGRVWLRDASGAGSGLAAEAGRLSSLQVREAGDLVDADASLRDKTLLAPLYGCLA